MLHVPFDLGIFAQNALAKHVHYGAILHIWSADLLDISVATATKKRNRLVYSAPSVSSTRDHNKLPWIAGKTGITVTTPTQAGLNLCLDLGADPTKFAHLPLIATPFSEAAQKGESLRNELGLSKSDFVITVTDEMNIDSGHKLAIWSHAIVRWALEGVKLLLPGKGENYQALVSFAKNTYYFDSVYFTKSRFSAEELLSACDIALYAGSSKQRNYADFILAGSLGKARIATATAESNELGAHRESAMLVKREPRCIGAKILELCENAELRNKLSENARNQTATENSREKCLEIRDQIYQSLRPIAR